MEKNEIKAWKEKLLATKKNGYDKLPAGEEAEMEA